MNHPLTPPERKSPPAASEGTREALDTTARPVRSDRATPQSNEEDTSLRNLQPRSTEEQFGQAPNIEPEADQHRGVKEWVKDSSEMDKSFPDDGDMPPRTAKK